MLDFSDLSVVDVHCHPYTRKDKLSADEWVDKVSFGGGSPEYLQEGGIEVDDAELTMLAAGQARYALLPLYVAAVGGTLSGRSDGGCGG